MNLEKLISSTKIIKIKGWIKDVEIENISILSREKNKNTLFIAQKGGMFDGHNFVDEAIINGAVALVLEKEIPEYSIPQIIVKNTRIAICTISSEFYNNPKDKLKFVGITGTNGKTSCAEFIAKMLNNNGKKCALIGTLGSFAGTKKYDTTLTTPDPIVFHKLLAEFVKDNVEYVCMECSAHALHLHKLDNITFEVGILTNITQDHLDYFMTMRNYAKAKLSWFFSGNVKNIIYNADDSYSKYLRYQNLQALSYGINSPSDVFVVNIEKTAKGTNFVMNLLDNVFKCTTNLVGNFNIYNCMAVATAGVCLGINFNSIIQSLQELKAPIGRFNVINLTNNKTIIIDFAHTPDGLEKALSSAREVCKGDLFCVFGCGGDRDKIKRPIMGKISESLATFTILTSDNPRFEKPDKILSDIEKGMKTHNYFKIADRKLAIKKIVEILKPNDIAIICGKGGELYQDINGIKIPYDDFNEVKIAVKEILGEDQIINIKENLC